MFVIKKIALKQIINIRPLLNSFSPFCDRNISIKKQIYGIAFIYDKLK